MVTVDEVKGPVLFFDGVCNLCNGAINFILDHEKSSQLKFAPLQSAFAQRLLKDKLKHHENLDSLVFLTEQNEVLVKSKAAFAISTYLVRPYSFVCVFRILPVFISDRLYDWIARNRYRWFGKSDQCRIPTPELKERFIDSAILS